jgi:tRNA A37 threonylcarbamoyladenosine dehydratase
MAEDATLKAPVSLRIDEPLFRRLFEHLFPGDDDEHGAVIAAGLATGPGGSRLLARELFLARDGIDYVPGQRGYRALTPQFVAEVSEACASQGLCYLAVHCHGGWNEVEFSEDDWASHERGYPALVDITRGGPVGALVFARNAVAGDLWTRQGRFALDWLTVVGPRVRTLYPAPPARPRHAGAVYDRHARLFGDAGQDILARLKVGIIGLGGGGSLINEWLARLGVGHLVAVDFDRVEPSNLPRVVGATYRDAGMPSAERNGRRAGRNGGGPGRYKVHVARRVARQANPSIHYETVVGNVLDEATARRLTDADFLFLASDSIQSRLVFNALVQQYLIPGVQVGAKVAVERRTRQVADVFVATRPVLPGPGQGCLHCHELIPASRLREEALTEGERRAQQYVEDEQVAEPSVITLNVLSAAQAVNDLLMMFTGLYRQPVSLAHQLHFVRERQLTTVEPRVDGQCLDCSCHAKSRRARGDGARLPCRALAAL